MSTKPIPSDGKHLDLFAALTITAGDFYDAISADKPVLGECRKHHKRLKLLVALADTEIKQLANKK